MRWFLQREEEGGCVGAGGARSHFYRRRSFVFVMMAELY